MSYFNETVVIAHVITCDKCGFTLKVETNPRLQGFDSSRQFHAKCAQAGWTFWAGRELRVYCPDCGPSKGHKMSDVTADYRRWQS
jgi:predicted RNA-binding Zn-ribbon protein involved in translation (DUF1610 family)